MATKKRKAKKKTSKRKGGLRGLRGSIGKDIGLFLTSVLATNLAHEGVDYLNSMDFMQMGAAKEGETPSKFNFKKIGLSGGLTLAGGGLSVMTQNPWLKAIATSVAVGASIHTKEDAVKPLFGLGAVDDFLDLYRTDEPLRDLSGADGRIKLAGVDPLMQKLA